MLNESPSLSCGVQGFVTGPPECTGIGVPPGFVILLFIGVRLLGELWKQSHDLKRRLTEQPGKKNPMIAQLKD